MNRIPDWIMRLDSFITNTFAIDFLVLTFMVKCLLISLYCLGIFAILWLFKRILKDKLSVRANYYGWYLLLLSIPMSGLPLSDGIKLFFYDIFFGGFGGFDVTSESLEMLMLITAILFSLRPFLFIATMIWLIVVIIKCVQQTITNIGLRRNINRQALYDDKNGLKQKAAAAFGLRADKIEVVAAEFIHSPVSYGIFRKTILLPADYNERYSSQEQYLLLLHEMGHIKNHDTVKLQLIDIMQCFIWPLRWMKKQFVRDSEILCDNRVLGIAESERDAYGELLLRECSTKQVVRGIAFSDSFHTLKKRIEAIYSYAPEKHRLAALSVIVTLILCTSAVYAAGHPASWLKETGKDDPMIYDEGKFDVSIHFTDSESGETILESPGLLDAPQQIDGEWVEYSSEDIEQNDKYIAMQDTYSYLDGEITIDKLALYQELLPYLESGVEIVGVEFRSFQPTYVDTTRESVFFGEVGSGMLGNRSVYLSINELEQTGEENRYETFPCGESMEERIYSFVAHWL